MINRTKLLISIFICSFFFSPFLNSSTQKWTDYETRLFSKWDKGEFNACIKMLDEAVKIFPAKRYLISEHKLYISFDMKDYDSFFTLWRKYQKEGFFYYFHFHKVPRSFLNDSRYKELNHKNRKLRSEAQLKTEAEISVILPENYIKGKNYPVYIFLHGYGRSNKKMMRWIDPDLLKKEYILAYFQSSVILGNDSFKWTVGSEVSRKDVKECFRKLKADYSVDTDRVVIGGMSAGGAVALDIVAENTIPVRGYIVNCPALKGRVELSDRIKVPGTIITGEFDRNIKYQKEFASKSNKKDAKCEIIVQKGLGHHFSKDFSLKISAALSRIAAYRKQN